MNKTELKQKAQDLLMGQVANALGYWTEDPSCRGMDYLGPEGDEFRAELQKQADRIAKMFGYDQAWSN